MRIPAMTTKRDLYNDSPFTSITTQVRDDSDGALRLIEIEAKVQIVAGEHTVLLDFSAYEDVDNPVSGSVEKEFEAVSRLIQTLTNFQNDLGRAINAARAVHA